MSLTQRGVVVVVVISLSRLGTDPSSGVNTVSVLTLYTLCVSLSVT